MAAASAWRARTSSTLARTAGSARIMTLIGWAQGKVSSFGVSTGQSIACRGSELARYAHARHCPDDRVAGDLESVHDLRLVCAPAQSRPATLADRGAGELGHCPVRVPVSGAGKSHRTQ